MRWIAIAFDCALFALCCFLVAEIANTLLAGWIDAPAPRAVAAPAPAEPVATDPSVVVERDLFGTRAARRIASAEPEPPPEGPPEELEETSLLFALVGTATASQPELSFATVLSRKSRETLLVAIGDEIDEHATVEHIERRRIVLDEGGELTELSLRDDDGSRRLTRAQAARLGRFQRRRAAARRR